MATPPAIPKALARIAMFHGGGSTERIFETQCAPLQKQLESEFELVYFAAPHTSSAGAGILPYFNFEEWGPYLGWYAKQENGEEYLDGSSGQYGDEEGIERVVRLMRECGPGGKWVGCLGFSQGTRVVSGLLLWQQQQRQKQQSTTETSLDNEIIDIQFGVLCMGAGEPMTSTMPEYLLEWDEKDSNGQSKHDNLVRIPSLHLHGLKDVCYERGKIQMTSHFDPATVTCIEIDYHHAMPWHKNDLSLLVEHIKKMHYK